MSVVENENTKEIFKFLLVGGTSVAIDLISYFGLISVGIEFSSAKGISFILGALFGYFANRSFTFQSTEKGPKTFLLFCLLYLITFALNVGVNKIMVQMLQDYQFKFFVAFIIATGTSTILNLTGLKKVVFKSK